MIILAIICLAIAAAIVYSLKKQPDACPHQGARACSGNCGQCTAVQDDIQIPNF